MSDGRRNNSGARGNKGGRGRPKKADELKIQKYIEDSIEKEYGSITKFWQFIAEKSKTSNTHLKYILEYWIGKPTERKEVAITELPTIKVEYTGLKGIDPDEIIT